MKKLLSILLAAILVFSFAACSSNKNDTPNETGDGAVKSSLELLTTVWGSYAEEDKFPAAGGDATEENMTMGDPGKFNIDDGAVMDTTLGFPAAFVDKIDDAASLVHMMNANTFTCGVFHVVNADDLSDVCAALEDNILQRQWICGFPDKLVVVKVGDYIVSFFGDNEIVDTFKTKLTEAYTSAETVCEEHIS